MVMKEYKINYFLCQRHVVTYAFVLHRRIQLTIRQTTGFCIYTEIFKHYSARLFFDVIIIVAFYIANGVNVVESLLLFCFHPGSK